MALDGNLRCGVARDGEKFLRKEALFGRNRMRSIGISLSIAAGLALALSSSGALAQSKQVLRFLTNETDPPSVEFFNKAIAAYEAENPDVDVEMEAISTDGRFQKIMANATSRTLPDVMKILPDERYEFVSRGFLSPLDDVIDQIGRDDFVEGTLTPINGKVYDAPYALGNFGVFYYRDDMYKAAGLKPPANWDELLSNCQKLTSGDNFGFMFPAGNTRATTVFFSMLMWSAGGNFFDKDLNVIFNSPETIKALEYTKELAKCAPPGVGSYGFGDMINVYLTGKIGQELYAPRLAANAAANTPDVFKNTNVTTIPVGPAGVGVKSLSINLYSIASPEFGGKQQDAAKKFVKYLLTGDRMKNFALTAFPHLIPPLKSVQAETIKEGAPLLANRAEFGEIAFDVSNSLEFVMSSGAKFENGKVIQSGVVNPYIGAIIARNIPASVVQRVIVDGEDPAEAAKEGAEEMQAVVDELKNK
jgi:ABC-type glycerol-3-phosphate transport system substrate-binding protein